MTFQSFEFFSIEKNRQSAKYLELNFTNFVNQHKEREEINSDLNVGVVWNLVGKNREIQPEMHSCVAFGAKKNLVSILPVSIQVFFV